MGSNGPKTVFNLLQLLGDVLLVNIAIIVAFLIRFQGDLPGYNIQPYVVMIPFISVFAALLFNFYGLYHTSNKKWSEVFASLIISLTLLMVLTICISYMIQGFSFPRSVFFIGALMQVILLGFWRWILLDVEAMRHPPRRIISIAPKAETSELLAKLAGKREQLLGIIVDDDKDKEINEAYSVLGAYDQAEEICRHYMPDAIIMCGTVPDETKENIVREGISCGWEVFVVPSIYEIMISQTVIEQIDDTPVLKIDSGINPGRDQFKRLMDCVISGAVLLVLSPVMLLIALAVKLDSHGPFLYTQERVGRGDKPFKLYKFRTMKNNAEEQTGPVVSNADDTRVTRVGRVLRAVRLDELPQLINVLMGDMSMVGPRPERPFFVKKYENDIPGYSCRHKTKAGITGLAQVMSNYSTSIEDKLRYDLLYNKKYSPLLDLKILFQTMKVILMRDRAS